MSRALEKVAREKGLQLHGPWLNKCIQLYETYLVRHGIMLVRPPGRVERWCQRQQRRDALPTAAPAATSGPAA